MSKQTQKGFTLIELMIVVAIIGILAAIALPAYQQYTKKAKFSEVIQATSGLKVDVEVCAQDIGDTTGCSGNANGIPANVASGAAQAKYLDSISVTDGTIKAKAKSTNGLAGEEYILKGVFTNGQVIWSVDPTSSCYTATPPICKLQ
jgi:type IV pilus assembly protein PilA